MKLPLISKRNLEALSNHFLRRSPGYPLGVSLGELDYLRGYADDFLGNDLNDRWLLVTAGTGAGAFIHEHGGVYRRSANTAASFAELILTGVGAVARYQLDADDGWATIIRMRATEAARTNLYHWFGARGSAAGDRFIMGGIIAGVANNWAIWCQDNVGNSTTDSGVAHDSNMHWLALEVTISVVRLWVDGNLVATHTTNISNELLRPYVGFYCNVNALRRSDVDYVKFIPRNL